MANKRSQFPLSICVSLDDANQEDDGSELTGPCFDSEDLSHNDLGGELTADPYYYPKLGGSQLGSSIHDKGQLAMKMQVARQQEKIDILLAKLSQYDVENKALKAEKAVLIDKLALFSHQDQEEPIARRGSWFSKASNSNGGSMQLLVDTNAKLMKENARKQVMVDVIQRSFQTFIKDSVKRSDKDELTIKALREENKNLLKRLSISENNLALSTSERSGKTCTESSINTPGRNPKDLDLDLSRHSTQDSFQRSSLASIPEQDFDLGTSGDEWIDGSSSDRDKVFVDEWVDNNKALIENAYRQREEATDLFNRNYPRRKSADLLYELLEGEGREDIPGDKSATSEMLVDFGDVKNRRFGDVENSRFGDVENRRPKTLDRRHSHSVGTSHDLLVGFNENRRSIVRTWSSYKW
mmetsp:Transcript_5310/g.9742  ORF Transcript_5310/g.9742 Transcript_5310/m.9742 type:complete len:411 (-) Transcript_5310:116-1348(-)|eukprot:CAMPEP_0183716178 /NCGR_PEP_ID=MMETSP0737-20130205/10172_1 /TAXON_ID=385413 /ORGANISM="Thalassiosira miniscula, Strain CCMP1093" /LENGTH=410 /DNA_ID=CAMNT_0025945401 /DNA_START=199 /DNA_END=1428 /DNA_ORIENTATION=+